jgi:hypothetical protein
MPGARFTATFTPKNGAGLLSFTVSPDGRSLTDVKLELRDAAQLGEYTVFRDCEGTSLSGASTFEVDAMSPSFPVANGKIAISDSQIGEIEGIFTSPTQAEGTIRLDFELNRYMKDGTEYQTYIIMGGSPTCHLGKSSWQAEAAASEVAAPSPTESTRERTSEVGDATGGAPDITGVTVSNGVSVCKGCWEPDVIVFKVHVAKPLKGAYRFGIRVDADGRPGTGEGNGDASAKLAPVQGRGWEYSITLERKRESGGGWVVSRYESQWQGYTQLQGDIWSGSEVWSSSSGAPPEMLLAAKQGVVLHLSRHDTEPQIRRAFRFAVVAGTPTRFGDRYPDVGALSYTLRVTKPAAAGR